MKNLIKAEPLSTVAGSCQYLTFRLAGEYYAVTTISVKEIIEYGQLTKVPMMPASIRGVINLRGAVVPVIDLAARFGSEQTQVGRRSCIVILEVGQGEDLQVIGVIVDAVNEVLEIAPADIEPPPAFGANIRTDFMLGMGKVAGRFVILLDVGKVLSVEELAALSASAGSAVL
jgi:purine-binding chemotaxis protein CheW